MADAATGEYLVGVGSYDVTGPAADVNMMGYAHPAQTAAGVHLRLHSRAFIIADPGGANRVVFVSVDACMASQAVTQEVLTRLHSRYGDLYTDKNVVISGIHTHSGPGGYLQYVTYLITSLGFVRQSFDALVDGIERSIVQAHESIRPGSIHLHQGELLDANINRSPNAYANNPAEERARYAHDTDKEMVLLRVEDASESGRGAISWFAVHCTSMNNTNRLISGDNKGVASRLMEDWADGRRNGGGAGIGEGRSISKSEAELREELAALEGRHVAGVVESEGPVVKRRRLAREECEGGACAEKSGFVAAFGQSNVGDTSPNVQGAFCIDTGKPCAADTSTCAGRNELCHGRGPAWPDDSVSNYVIGDRQFQKARALYEEAQTAGRRLKGPVDSRHSFIDMANVSVVLENGARARTCKPAMGFSFAAGTTDGPGAFDFTQGDAHGNPFWRLVSSFLHRPSPEQITCHHPKPILLDTGEMYVPYPWEPSIVPISILRVGQLFILGVPGEFTTMAGRRLREAVERVLSEAGAFPPGGKVVIAGLANTYSSYITTFEEYQVQRYEGASTLYGPHTLRAYIQEFSRLARALALGEAVDSGPQPPNLLARQFGFLPPVLDDTVPFGVKFGDPLLDVPKESVFTPNQTVSATFWTGCPRNDLRTNGTFALVERHVAGPDSWEPAYDDDDYSLKYHWRRPSHLFPGHSLAVIEWAIPSEVEAGVYRLRHFGAAKPSLFFPATKQFSGVSRPFVVLS